MDPNQTLKPGLLSTQEVMAYLGVSNVTFQLLLKRGKIPPSSYIRLGTGPKARRRFDLALVLAALGLAP